MAPPQEGPETTMIDEEANVEFSWGVKRNKGVKGKDIQFYDSFTYDGVEYSSYDCVYVHKEGEPEPYIGKIMKIWDDLKLKKKRIKVWWFFRPIEIRNFYEGDCSPANKELFLASGEGKGVFNVNLLAWDERLKKGFEERAVIRVQNFDPSYTSAEIDDIMWHVVGERCTTQVMPQTMFSNPNSGDALVVFRKKEGAEMALKKLNQASLTFSDGRSLIATRASPVMSGKQKFAGHISVEKHKILMQRGHHTADMKKAVSTSHCSQPNTIEYEMAMEWRVLQEKSERWWNELYKQEASEVNDVKHKNMVSRKGN